MRKPDTQTAIHQINRALLILLLLASGLWAPSFAVAQSKQESPLDTQLLPIGELFSLIIRADGESDPPARITAKSLPNNAVLLRNLDGSRTFMWIPQKEDIGDKTIEVTVTDAQDSAIAATYPIHFEVVDQLVGTASSKEEVTPNTTASGEPEATNDNTDTEAAAEPDTKPTAESVAESVAAPDTESVAEPDTKPTAESVAESVAAPDTESVAETVTESVAETVTESVAETVTESVAAPVTESVAETLAAPDTESDTESVMEPDTVAATEPETETVAEPDAETALQPEAVPAVETESNVTVESADTIAEATANTTVTDAVGSAAAATALEGDETEEQQLPPPQLNVPSQAITASIYKELRIVINHSDLSGTPANLTALNMPKKARLEPTAEGHVIEWTPDVYDIGETAIILIATDKQSSDLRTSRRLNISVSR